MNFLYVNAKYVVVIGPNHITCRSLKCDSARLGIQNSLVPSLIFMMTLIAASDVTDNRLHNLLVM